MPAPRIIVTGTIAAGKSLATSYILEWLSEHLDCNPQIRRIDAVKSVRCVKGGEGEGSLYRILDNGSVEYMQPDILLPELIGLLLKECEQDVSQEGFILEFVQTELWRAVTEKIGSMTELLQGSVIIIVRAPKEVRLSRNQKREGIHHIPDHVLEKTMFNTEFTDEQLALLTSSGADIFTVHNNGSPAELHQALSDIMEQTC